VRRLTSAALGLGLAAGLLGSGCWDFDARYLEVTTCHQALCPYGSYTGSDVFLHDSYYYSAYRVSAGVVGRSLDDLVVYTAAGNETTEEYAHALLHFSDGGVTRTDITQQMLRYSRGVEAVGTTSDLWAVGTEGAVRFQDSVPGPLLASCRATTGNLYGAYEVSANEVYFTGTDAICRWTGGTTTTQLFPEALFADLSFLNTAWVSPQGELLAGGCQRDAGYDCTSHVFLVDGGTPAISEDYDFEDYGLMSISGVGSDVWAASRTGAIFRRTDGGAFTMVHNAGYGLFDLQAVAANDVWAVGDNGISALHFDGSAWTQVLLAPAPTSTSRWERVHPVPGGLVVAGAMDSPDAGGLVPVVRLYRRGN
jgi:hypothetical protein